MTQRTYADPRKFLADSLQRRVPTWEVAQAVLDLGAYGSTIYPSLKQLAAARRYGWGHYMNDDFDRPVPAAHQLEVFARLFDVPVQLELADDYGYVRGRVRLGMAMLGLSGEHASPSDALIAGLHHELAAGPRKRLRFLSRLEQKASRLQDVQRLRRAQMQAKSRLAYAIDPDVCSDRTLAFCAYLASRANQRSLFMVGKQSRAFDEIAAGMLDDLDRLPDVAWHMVALVAPMPRVIERVPEFGRGVLLGGFHRAMTDAAEALDGLYDSLPERMRAEMVVVRGVDSSRWNAYAGALNTMRSAWVATLAASGAWGVMDQYLPGKAPRLMASDVAWMYRSRGMELHEDTRMFAALPRPWDVVFGRTVLTRADVLRVAAHCGVDAEKTGWVGPRAPQELERSAPEPALVHGVVVSDPRLAHNLRRCGVFSAGEYRHVDELPDVLVRGVRTDGERVIPTVEGAISFDQPEGERVL